MGKSTPRAPTPPDYVGAAREQGTANIAAATQGASLSNPNIVSPYGNQTVTYGNTGPNGMTQPTVTQTLTPAAQATLESQQEVQRGLADVAQTGIGNAQDILNTPFNPNLPNLQTSLEQPGQLNYGPQAGMYGANTGLDLSGVAQMPVNAGTTGQQAIMSRLAPQIEQSRAATEQRLANQGITPGSEAYNNEMRTQGQQFNDLTTQAALQGIGLDTAANQQGFNQALGAGGFYNTAQGQNFGQAATGAGLYNQAQNQAYNQGMGGAQFGNTALQQSLAQQLALRNQPINEIGALMGGSQIQNPQFQQYTGQNVAAAPIFQGVQQQGQSAMDAYGIRANAAASANQGLYSALGAGASMIGMSDVRLKSNIVRVGTHPLGIGIYEYDIFDRRERGVMAQELEKVKPEAVLLHPSGYKMVDYGAI
jgi:hypothetical protein